MKKVYDLCDMTSQQLFNLYDRIKSNKYHTIQVYDKKYYSDNKYIENNISIWNNEGLQYIVNNIKDICHYGIILKADITIYGRYVKVWY